MVDNNNIFKNINKYSVLTFHSSLFSKKSLSCVTKAVSFLMIIFIVSRGFYITDLLNSQFSACRVKSATPLTASSS